MTRVLNIIRSCKSSEHTQWGETISIYPLWQVFYKPKSLIKYQRTQTVEKPYECSHFNNAFSLTLLNYTKEFTLGRNLLNVAIVIRLFHKKHSWNTLKNSPWGEIINVANVTRLSQEKQFLKYINEFTLVINLLNAAIVITLFLKNTLEID